MKKNFRLKKAVVLALVISVVAAQGATAFAKGNNNSAKQESRIVLTGDAAYEGKAKLKFEAANDDGPDVNERSLSVEVDGPNGTVDIFLNGVDVGDMTIVLGSGNFDLDDAVAITVSGAVVEVRSQGPGARVLLSGTF